MTHSLTDSPEVVRLVVLGAVHVGAVEPVRDLVQRFEGARTAVDLRGAVGADEALARHVLHEGVVGGDLGGERGHSALYRLSAQILPHSHSFSHFERGF